MGILDPLASILREIKGLFQQCIKKLDDTFKEQEEIEGHLEKLVTSNEAISGSAVAILQQMGDIAVEQGKQTLLLEKQLVLLEKIAAPPAAPPHGAVTLGPEVPQ